ncbi:MAG: tRNA-binding protein [Bacteroidota bacterium]
MTTDLTWEQFLTFRIHVGTILEARPFPEARNPSYRLLIDFGKLGTRKSSAQITDKYTADELAGHQVAAVLNFPPKQIANMMSECLVLGAVDDQNVVTLLQPTDRVENGTRIA